MKLKWDLEEKCNLNCKHCIVGATDYPPSVSIEKAKEVIEKCSISGVDNIVLSTKEPFMYPYMKELIEYCSLFNVKLSIITNGTLISDEILKILMDNCRIINYIAFSLEGINAETNDFVRGYGVFNKVMDIVSKIQDKNLSESKTIKLILQMNLTSKNYADIDRMISVLNEFPFIQVAIGKLYIDGNAIFHKELDLDNYRYEKAITTLIKSYMMLSNPRFELTFKDMSLYDTIFFNLIFGTSYRPNIPDCSIFHGGFSLMSNGEYCACTLLLDKNLIENSKLFMGKFDDSDIIEATNSFNMPENYFEYKNNKICSKCKFINSCRMCFLIGLSNSNRDFQIKKCNFYMKKIAVLMNLICINKLRIQLNPNVIILMNDLECTVYNGQIGVHEFWSYKTTNKDEIKIINKLRRPCYYGDLLINNKENDSLITKLLYASLLYIEMEDISEYEYEKLLSITE